MLETLTGNANASGVCLSPSPVRIGAPCHDPGPSLVPGHPQLPDDRAPYAPANASDVSCHLPWFSANMKIVNVFGFHKKQLTRQCWITPLTEIIIEIDFEKSIAGRIF